MSKLVTAFARSVIRLIALALLVSQAVCAEPAGVTLERSIDGRAWLVSADVEPPRSSRLEEAATRGVPLQFILEFELIRPRWYWWDQKIAQQSVALRLSYHALAREFRVARDDGSALSFDSFDAALLSIAQVRNWRIEQAEPLQSGDYLAQVRLRLDTTQLPRPLQVDALTNREWNPQVEWTRTSLTLPSTPKSAQ